MNKKASETILSVEDNPQVRDLGSHALSVLGLATKVREVLESEDAPRGRARDE